MIKVRIPATAANLGPGFDCLGLALSLYGDFQFEETEGGLCFSGVAEKFRNPDNLAVKAYHAVLERLGLPSCGLRISIDSGIPPARGLGSSASLIAAGIAAANAAHGSPLQLEEQVEIAALMEGHPDNVAPAIAGGLVISVMDGAKVRMQRCPVSENLRFCVLVPDFPISTGNARAVLPKTVPFKDAVFNISRTAMLIKALETGNLPLIGIAMQDRLHQRFRLPLISEAQEVVEMAKGLGSEAFCISGSGPALLFIYEKNDFAEAMSIAVQRLGHRWRAISLRPSDKGAIVI